MAEREGGGWRLGESFLPLTLPLLGEIFFSAVLLVTYVSQGYKHKKPLFPHYFELLHKTLSALLKVYKMQV